MVAITADYRVNSRHQSTIADSIRDAKSAVRWVRGNAARLGIDRARIVGAGGSAGGHLAVSTALLPGFDEANESAKVSARPPIYSPRNQCAAQVHHYLQIGGGDKLASLWSRNTFAIWSPDDVEDYARSIVSATSNLGSSGVKIEGEGTMFRSKQKRP